MRHTNWIGALLIGLVVRTHLPQRRTIRAA